MHMVCPHFWLSCPIEKQVLVHSGFWPRGSRGDIYEQSYLMLQLSYDLFPWNRPIDMPYSSVKINELRNPIIQSRPFVTISTITPFA